MGPAPEGASPRRDAPLVCPPRLRDGRNCNGPRGPFHPQGLDCRRPGRGRLGHAHRVGWDGRPRWQLLPAWQGAAWDPGGVVGRSLLAPQTQRLATPPAACGGCIAGPGARGRELPPPSGAQPLRKGVGSGEPVGDRPGAARPAKGRPDGPAVARIALNLQGMRPGPRPVASGLAAAPKPRRSVGFGCSHSLDPGRNAWKLWPWNRP
jgi:hypothetical protein